MGEEWNAPLLIDEADVYMRARSSKESISFKHESIVSGEY